MLRCDLRTKFCRNPTAAITARPIFPFLAEPFIRWRKSCLRCDTRTSARRHPTPAKHALSTLFLSHPQSVRCLYSFPSGKRKVGPKAGRRMPFYLVFFLLLSRCGGANLSDPQKSEDSYVTLNFRPTWPEVLRCRKGS